MTDTPENLAYTPIGRHILVVCPTKTTFDKYVANLTKNKSFVKKDHDRTHFKSTVYLRNSATSSVDVYLVAVMPDLKTLQDTRFDEIVYFEFNKDHCMSKTYADQIYALRIECDKGMPPEPLPDNYFDTTRPPEPTSPVQDTGTSVIRPEDCTSRTLIVVHDKDIYDLVVRNHKSAHDYLCCGWMINGIRIFMGHGSLTHLVDVLIRPEPLCKDAKIGTIPYTDVVFWNPDMFTEEYMDSIRESAYRLNKPVQDTLDRPVRILVVCSDYEESTIFYDKLLLNRYFSHKQPVVHEGLGYKHSTVVTILKDGDYVEEYTIMICPPLEHTPNNHYDNVIFVGEEPTFEYQQELRSKCTTDKLRLSTPLCYRTQEQKTTPTHPTSRILVVCDSSESYREYTDRLTGSPYYKHCLVGENHSTGERSHSYLSQDGEYSEKYYLFVLPGVTDVTLSYYDDVVFVGDMDSDYKRDIVHRMKDLNEPQRQRLVDEKPMLDREEYTPEGYTVTSIEEHVTPTKNYSHYFKDVSNLDTIDIYRVLSLYEVTDPCIQHAIKKLLCSGKRGVKDTTKDVEEAIVSLNRYLEMREEDEQ